MVKNPPAHVGDVRDAGSILRCRRSPYPMFVLYWTGIWWSGVDDERVKEVKRLIFPGLYSRLPRSRESARNREREKEKKRKKERHWDQNSDGAKVF